MNEQAIATIVSIIRELHTNPQADRTELAARFKEASAHVSAVDIAAAEQRAIEEGVPIDSIRKLCDVHLDLFTDEAQRARAELPAGHPLSILYVEHDTLLSGLRNARKVFLPDPEGPAPDTAELVRTVQETLAVMQAASRYFEKEENALFPVIERHGITKPPSIMWGEHDSLRDTFKEFAGLGPGDRERGGRLLLMAEEILTSHVHKEETILFRTALNTITPQEWRQIRADFDEIGYMHARPEPMPGGDPVSSTSGAGTDGQPGAIALPSGSLSVEQLVAVLNALPLDLTFVDADDRVVWFSEPVERVFPRARSVVGRSVQNCHPPRSIHIVEEILRSFRSGERDSEEFYLHLGERYIHIRYLAIRSERGEYLGCLEASQDIAPLQAISGEKRIL